MFPHLDVLCGQEALKDLHGQDRSTAVVGNGFEEACAGLAEDSLRHVAHRAQELRHDHGEENLRPLLHSSDDLQFVGIFFLAVGALCTQILVQWQRISKVKEGGGDIEKRTRSRSFVLSEVR